MPLCYYCHRFSGYAANLIRAKRNFAVYREEYARKGVVLWAPWIALADAGVPEADVWPFIEAAITVSGGILYDLDGESAIPGMLRERGIAELLGKGVLAVG
jgi:alpha-beta hydrolase superfamily lysophospholipase